MSSQLEKRVSKKNHPPRPTQCRVGCHGLAWVKRMINRSRALRVRLTSVDSSMLPDWGNWEIADSTRAAVRGFPTSYRLKKGILTLNINCKYFFFFYYEQCTGYITIGLYNFRIFYHCRPFVSWLKNAHTYNELMAFSIVRKEISIK